MCIRDRVLLCLAGAQGLAALVDYRAVPVRLTQHGQAEGNEVVTGIRGIDSIRHRIYLQMKERQFCSATQNCYDVV